MRLLLLLIALLAGQALSPAVHAHAGLVSVSPAAVEFSTAPPAVVLTFSEPVTPLLFRLLNPNGEAVPLDDVQAQGNDVRIGLPALRSQGTYALSWRVVSADGHPIGDTRLVTIGARSAAPAAPAAPADAGWRTAAIWLSGLAIYLTLFFGLGAIVFQALVRGGRNGADLVAAPAAFARAGDIGTDDIGTDDIGADDIGAGDIVAGDIGAGDIGAHPVSGMPWLYAGLAAVLAYAGFTGLDALDAALPDFFHPAVWAAAARTSNGLSTSLALFAFACAIVAARLLPRVSRQSGQAAGMHAALAPGHRAGQASPQQVRAEPALQATARTDEDAGYGGELGGARRRHSAALTAALAAWAAAALSLAVTGHAAAAPPAWLARPAVWVHGASVLFWIGALYPLLRAVRRASPADLHALGRFSRWIPWFIAFIIGSGVVLFYLQIGGAAPWWTTEYGWILIAKLVLVAVLLCLGAWNRFRLTAGSLRGEPPTLHRLGRMISVEILVAAAIFALVALWRFTPPPRAYVPPPQIVQAQGSSDAVTASAVLTMPGAAGPGALEIKLQTRDGKPLAAQAVAVSLSSESAGIEPIRHDAVKTGPGAWRVAPLLLPALPAWTLQVDALISDFERVSIEIPLWVKNATG